MGKFFKFMLPLIFDHGSIMMVIALLAFKNSQRAERKPETNKAILVDTINAEIVSLNLTVSSQGTVRPRTETALVAEVSGKLFRYRLILLLVAFSVKAKCCCKLTPVTTGPD